jgi:catechol 2,3-dioxygenase-like lactoylglutathione lyase family enzyme
MLRIDERPVVPRPPPPNRTDLVPRLAHTVHNVRDLDAAVAFYRDVFGYQVVTVDRALGVTFLSAGDDHHTIALQEVVRRPRDGLRRLASLVRGVREGRALPSWPVVRASLRPGHNHTGYRVPDEAALRAFVARLRAAGGRVAWAVNHGDLIKAAYFVDPAGNLCEVFVDGEGAIALRERMARGEPLASLAPEDLPTYPLDLS